MKLRTTMLALLFAAGILAACQNGTRYAPQVANPSDSVQAALLRVPLPAPFDRLAAELPNAAGVCNAPDLKIPGNYISMIATGSVKGSTFTSSSLVAVWFISKYTKGKKPTPPPSPGTTATPKPPKPFTIYFYTGTYTTKKTKQTGCAILFYTTSGKPIDPGTGAISANSPQFAYPYIDASASIASGSMTEKITGLSATGGHGTAILTSMKGKPYDTATITLTKRIVEKYQ